jgi:predicted PurR-regulated permease PerM
MKRNVNPSAAAQDAAPWSQFSRSFALVVVVIALFAFLGFIGQAFQTLFLGFLIAFLFYRPIRWLGKRIRFRRASAVVHLGLMTLLIAIIVWGLGFLAPEVASYEQALSQNVADSGLAAVVQALQSSGVPGSLAGSIRGLITSVVSLVGVAFIAIIFSFWLVNDLWKARGIAASMFDGAGLRQAAVLLHRIDQIWIGYLTAQIIFGLVMMGASLIEYWILGVPYFALMAVLTGILTLIPSIGGLIASIVVAVPCLVFGSTRFTTMDPVAFTVLVTAINIITTQVAYNFIAVPVIGRYVRLPAGLVLIAVIVGVGTGNFLLAFLIVPLLSSLRIAAGYLLAKSRGLEPYPGEDPPATPEEGLFGLLAAASESSGA